MKTLTLTAVALAALAGPSFADESLAKQVERHFAQDKAGIEAIVLPEVSNSVVMSSSGADLSQEARRILATGDSWTDSYVPGTGTRFSVDAASATALAAIEHFAADVDGSTEN